MTVPATPRSAGPYIGTGALVFYPFTFKVFAAADVRAMVADADGYSVELVHDSTMLVVLNPDQEATPGGTVQYAVDGVATALPTGYQLAINGENLSFEQPADLPQGGSFNPVNLENALDRLQMQVLILAERVSRAVLLPLTDTGADTTLPAALQRASKAVTFDSSGNLSVTAPDSGSAAGLAAALLSNTGPTNGGALVGFGLETDYLGAGGTPVNTAQAIQEMLGTKVFTLYVATTGSDANDGSISAPFATLQKACDVLMSIGTVGGARRVSVGAGTWSSTAARVRLGPSNMSRSVPNGTAYLQDGAAQANWLYIEGADVGWNPPGTPRPVPTTIFNGGGTSSYGIQIEGPWKVLIRNIKFTDYNGSASTYAVSCDKGHLRCENVHTSGCNGVSITHGTLEVCGGLFYGSALKEYVGIRSISGSQHAIGSQTGPVGEGPLFSFLNQGILAQENSTGHCDYTEYEDCNDGLRIISSSRFNCEGASFKRCVRGIRATENSNFFATAGSLDFHDGTADACTENKVMQTGSVDIQRDSQSNTLRASDYTSTMQTVTGTTAAVDVLVKTLKRGDWCPNVNSLRLPQHIWLHVVGEITGTAATKKIRLRLGATVLAEVTIPAANIGFYTLKAGIYFTDSNVQKAWLEVFVDGVTTPFLDVDNGSEDMSAADLDLKFQIQLTDGADSVNALGHFGTAG